MATFPRSFMAGLLAIALAVTAVTAGPARAQVLDPGTIINNLDRSAVRTIRNWLQRQAPESPFKVPANVEEETRCILSANGMRCFRSLAALRCPSVVVVEVGGERRTVPVNCTGPDSEGNCDCEFASY